MPYNNNKKKDKDISTSKVIYIPPLDDSGSLVEKLVAPVDKTTDSQRDSRKPNILVTTSVNR